jgi:feruloyl esterase
MPPIRICRRFASAAASAQTSLAFADYYEQVLAVDQSAADDVRLFLMPGVEHCFGGPGPSWVNFLDEIDNWVETGNAPDQVIAYWLDGNMQPAGSRPVCAYPVAAEYDGEGDTMRRVSAAPPINEVQLR